MRITRGPMLEKFAGYFDIPIAEVVDWVNRYVNHPEDFENQHLIEKTESERVESIKAYIQMRINASSNERIRASLSAGNAVAA